MASFDKNKGQAVQVQGYFDLKFEKVRDAFAEQLADPQQRGAALCVQIGGETVLDLWGGYTDRHQQEAWHTDTLVNVFSATKPFAAVAALQLVAEGKLTLETQVADIWPEFAKHHKAAITLRMLLSHRAGVTAIAAPLAPEALYDWSAMTAALADQAPWWTPDAEHGYAPITYGWLIGELIRRIENQEPGQAIIERTARALNLDFYIGLPASEFARVSDVTRGKWPGDEAAMRLGTTMLSLPKSMSTLSFNNPPSVMTSTNKPQWRTMAQPAANGHGNARSLAGFYQGLLSGQLLNAELLTELRREHSVGMDNTLLTQTRFGLGVMLDQPSVANATYGLGAQSFGHPGAGGCIGFADPEREVAFGYVTNTLGPYVLMDPRAQRLAKCVGECLG